MYKDIDFYHLQKKFGDKYGKKLLDTATKTGINTSRKFGDKHGKKLMDTATKTGIDAAKTASKRVVQKTAEATGDLIGNNIPDKITSLGKSKKQKEDEANEVEEIYIPQKRDNKLLMT